MRKKEVKRLLRAQPAFEEWIKADPMRVAKIRTNPAIAEEYYAKWNSMKSRRKIKEKLSLDNITQKTKRVHDKLQNLQAVLDIVSEKSKR